MSKAREHVGAGPLQAGVQMRGKAPPSRPLSRDLVRMIREISKKDALSLGDGLRAIEERQAREIEFFLQACALRLESCV